MIEAAVRTARVEGLLRLIGEASELPASFRRQHVLDGACRLLGASSMVMVLVKDFLPKRKSQLVSAAFTGWADAHQRSYLSSIIDGSCADPAVSVVVALPGPRTRRRQDLLSDRDWYETPWVRERLRPAHMDHTIYSARPTGTLGAIEGIAVYRSWGDRSFTEEDRELLHLLNMQGAWLFKAPEAPQLAEALRVLSPRQRQTLMWLCRGASEKEIATKLGLSRHTVHGHVKALHRFFGVSSRAELVASCRGHHS